MAVFGRNGGEAERLAFVLRVRGFDAGACAEDAALAAFVAASQTDGVLVRVEGDPARAERVLEVAKVADPRVRVAMLPDRPLVMATRAEMTLPPGASRECVLEAVRVLCARKRGPRKETAAHARRDQATGRYLPGVVNESEFPQAVRA